MLASHSRQSRHPAVTRALNPEVSGMLGHPASVLMELDVTPTASGAAPAAIAGA
jgi:hypothetical protein